MNLRLVGAISEILFRGINNIMSKGFLGRHHSEESKRKIGEASKRLGLKPPSGKGIFNPMFGRHHSEVSKQKISNATKGRVSPRKGIHLSAELKQKLSKAVRGYRHSEEALCKMRGIHGGDKNPNWKGGITPQLHLIRNSPAIIQWRNSVFERDNYTCQNCGTKKVYLHAHHILNFCNYDELRFVLNNGVTLCKHCHRGFHKQFGQRNNTNKQLNKFLGFT